MKGPHFFVLHEKFEELYESASEIVDTLAERVVALGGVPHSTLQAQLAAARLSEDATQPAALQMVDNVIADIDALITHTKAAAEAAGDDSVTVAKLEGILEGYADRRWMLDAFRAG